MELGALLTIIPLLLIVLASARDKVLRHTVMRTVTRLLAFDAMNGSLVRLVLERFFFWE
jgi:hypothetical protein